MSLPPPPNPYGGQPSYGGQPPYGGQPQWGGQQPAGGGAGEGQFSGPPPWGGPPQQPQWGGPPPGPPPGKGGKGKWILGGVILLLVIALAVTITVLVVKPDSNGPSATPTTNGADSEFASAKDTGPVNIITEDPTCDAWGKISREYGDGLNSVGWESRDKAVGSNSWSPDQRSKYESAGRTMTKAADQAAKLATATPNRLMRELYEQFIAYTREFTDRIPTYEASDDSITAVANAAGNSLNHICSAINSKSAAPVAPLVKAPTLPTQVVAPTTPDQFDQFLTKSNEVCGDWVDLAKQFDDETSAWRALDPNIPAVDWSADQRSINEQAAATMNSNADKLEALGRRSGNPVLEDIAVGAAQYRRGAAQAIPTYTPADNYLAQAASNMAKVINFGCKATQ